LLPLGPESEELLPAHFRTVEQLDTGRLLFVPDSDLIATAWMLFLFFALRILYKTPA